MKKVFASPLKNYLTSYGFVPISNLLLDYQEELGLTEGELLFIIRVLRHKNGFILHDEDLDPTVSSRTLARRRNSLKEKGYLNFNLVKKQDEFGHYQTDGINYDFSQLENKLQALADAANKNKEKELEKFVEKTSREIEDENILKYKQDYEEYYGIPYTLNEYEYKKYSELNDEDKKLISHIFDYCKEYGLLNKIVPRLSLFFKAKFRFEELKKFVLETSTVKEEINPIDNSKLIYDTYKSFNYNSIEDNYPFYKAIERLVNKFCSDGIWKDGINTLIKKAHDDSLRR